MLQVIQVNPEPKKATRINTDRSRIVNMVRESQSKLSYMDVVRMAERKLHLTRVQAKGLVGKCLHPDTGYLVRAVIK